jgi:RHS repeat-associated protein
LNGDENRVSAALALSSPRRIKASHRRRRRIASGHFVQRYYDQSVGRFLSVDPVAARQSGDNFNRYAYAFNNPYKFFDPDGRDGSPFSMGVRMPGYER